jgi:hypothetical protein
MTVTEIIKDALDLFDEPADTDGKYNRDGYVLLTRFFNRYYKDVCKKTGCYRTTTTIKTVSDKREYDLPANNCGVKKVVYNGIPLIPISESRAFGSHGPPQEYYTIGLDAIGFNPLPKAVYTATVHYFAKPTADISGDSTPDMVPEDYHWVISYGITAELFKIDKGDGSGGYAKWNGIYLAAIDQMKAELRRSGRDKFPAVG